MEDLSGLPQGKYTINSRLISQLDTSTSEIPTSSEIDLTKMMYKGRGVVTFKVSAQNANPFEITNPLWNAYSKSSTGCMDFTKMLHKSFSS